MGEPPVKQVFFSSSSSSSLSESEELQRLEQTPPFWSNKKKTLSKQLSMCETFRDKAWEKRRRQILQQERKKKGIIQENDQGITDEDLNELKGSIELGFGFKEEAAGQKLCNTLPALDLYFAVNRNLSSSPMSSPNSSSRLSVASSVTSTLSTSTTLGRRSSSFGSGDSDSWKICSPGDDPQQVKTKLRQWAQVVACSVMQST